MEEIQVAQDSHSPERKVALRIMSMRMHRARGGRGWLDLLAAKSWLSAVSSPRTLL